MPTRSNDFHEQKIFDLFGAGTQDSHSLDVISLEICTKNGELGASIERPARRENGVDDRTTGFCKAKRKKTQDSKDKQRARIPKGTHDAHRHVGCCGN